MRKTQNNQSEQRDTNSSFTQELGRKVKELRLKKNLTLKELGERAGLSLSYISMLERGVVSMSLTSMQKIAQALEVDNGALFSTPKEPEQEPFITRGYAHSSFRLEGSHAVYRSLIGLHAAERVMEPLYVTLLPGQTRENVVAYTHDGEEFAYVLEGIVTYLVEDREYQLYPGDAIHLRSETPHQWANLTNNVVKLISVSTSKVMD